MELEQHDFELIRDLIYQETGMMFEDRKLSFVQTRLARRMAAADCDSPRAYYRYLRYQDGSGVELQKLIEALTTNETYFFREYPQLECFTNHALPAITAANEKRSDHRLKIWSAACSTGDEPYTLAIILDACLESASEWRTEITATDIDTNVLAAARRGVYGKRAVKDVPEAYLDKYFESRADGYHVVDKIKEIVSFSQVNLLDRPAMRRFRGFDLIFCRNVLIYFDDVARRKVLSSFYDSLKPGGFIFLGHSESVGRISAAFEMVSLDDYIAYRRPMNDSSADDTAFGGELCLTR